MIDLAILTAINAHKGQVRKGTDIPYITHPIAVGVLLAKAGCGDTIIVAGILHDTVEDTPVTLDFITDKFGYKVAGIVKACSENKSLSWEERKKHTIDELKTAPPEICLVSCADKLHNIQSITADYKEIGEILWERFNRGKEKQSWYYTSFLLTLQERIKTFRGTEREQLEKLLTIFKGEVERLFGRVS